MGGYADKLQKKAVEVLGPEERLVAAIRTMPRGTTMGTAIGGLVGSAVAQRQASRAQSDVGSDSLAARWPKGNSAVGLTDKRLILFNYTALGKPKDLVADFTLGDVASVDLKRRGSRRTRSTSCSRTARPSRSSARRWRRRRTSSTRSRGSKAGG